MAIQQSEQSKTNQELHRKWRDSRADWDEEARKDLDFFLGNHFTADESSDLSSRNQADVPMDRIAPAVDKLKSMLTAKPPVFTAIPREDSDAKVTAVWRTILGYVWDTSDGDTQMKQAIQDYAVTGLGYLYAYIDADADFGRGDVKFTHVNPFRVYAPPDCRDRWFTDAEGIILSTILTGEQVVNLYPELGEQVDPETGEVTPGIIEDLSTILEEDFPDSTNRNSMKAFTPAETKDSDWWHRQKYQILERFYPTKIPFYRVVDNRNNQESVMDEEAFTTMLQENPGAIERGFMEFEEIMQPRIAVSATIAEIPLYESVLNIDTYPIVPIPNIWTETPYPKSDVSRARPMQRLLNKLWSLALSHAQASAGLKLIVPMGSVPNMEDLERDWSNPNAVIEVDTTQGEPHYPAPQPLAGEFYRLIQQCEFYIDFSFGLPEMMHGVPDKAPETVRGTERMISLGSERPKSKLRDVEFSINRLGRVLYGLSKGHYTFEKMFALAQPNNDLTEVTINLYDDVTQPVNDIFRDRLNIGQHDVRIQPGSTLPESKWATYQVYVQAFQMGLIDRMEVLKKNPEIFDKEGILGRLNDYQRYESQIQGLQGQVKELTGDLQTARRESVHDRMRVEVSKMQSKLSDISSQSDADRKVSAAKLDTAVKLGERDIKEAVRGIKGAD
jgi:hypothetical protein|tara:strand:+ start:922 stop:2934 length:2013 start_codon:yes stop_codon:yes gene_type:complete